MRYDYHCDSCGNVLKDFFKSVHVPHPDCPVCHQQMKQTFGDATKTEVIYKGFGFACKDNIQHGGRKP